MRHLFKVAARALGAHSRSLMSDAQKAGLREAERHLKHREIEEAAKKYNAWWKLNTHYLESSAFKNDPDSQSEFAKWLPNMLKAFWGCDCDDGCKDHIKEVWDKRIEGSGAVLHTAAARVGLSGDNQENVGMLSAILEELKLSSQTGKLLEKNSKGINAIEIAFMYDNKTFLQLVRDICDVPQRADIESMDQLGYIGRLKESIDPEIEALLMGGQEVAAEGDYAG